MIINVNTELKSYEGEIMEQATKVGNDGNVIEKKPWTFGSCAINALMAMTEKDRNLSGEEKLKRYKLATKISGGGEINFTIDELKQIKDRVGLVSPTVLCGSMYLILENVEADNKAKGKTNG